MQCADPARERQHDRLADPTDRLNGRALLDQRRRRLRPDATRQVIPRRKPPAQLHISLRARRRARGVARGSRRLDPADDQLDAKGRVDWTGLAAEDRQMLHQFAQAGRSDVQDSPPLPRLREERWLLYPTRALPAPQRLFRAPCMQTPAQQAANRILQPLGLQVCHCDYHSANWRAAAKLAIAARRVAHLQAPRAEEGQIGWLASEHLRTRLDRPRTIDAALSLLGDPIALTSDGTDYIDVQHRSISMRDQRVRMVPLTTMLATSNPAPEPARSSLRSHARRPLRSVESRPRQGCTIRRLQDNSTSDRNLVDAKSPSATRI